MNPEHMDGIPLGIDAEAVAKVAQPGDLWLRSNDFTIERHGHSDGRASWPSNPDFDRPETYSRRLVGPWVKEAR